MARSQSAGAGEAKKRARMGAGMRDRMERAAADLSSSEEGAEGGGRGGEGLLKDNEE